MVDNMAFTEPFALDESTYRDMHFINRYECKFCLNIYFSKQTLIKHVKMVHTRNGNSSDFVYYHDRNYEQYLEEVMPSGEATTQYKCKECDEKVYSDYHVFKRHVHFVHLLTKTDATCVDCGEIFSNSTEMQKHKVMHPQNGRIFLFFFYYTGRQKFLF
jgi:hypothetical protein